MVASVLLAAGRLALGPLWVVGMLQRDEGWDGWLHGRGLSLLRDNAPCADLRRRELTARRYS